MAVHDIKGKTCLITGGAAGLGALYVFRSVLERRCQVCRYDITEDNGKALAEKLNETYPGKVEFYKRDVGEEASIVQAFNALADNVKQLDVIINNAGTLNDSENIWSTTCDVNWYVAMLDIAEDNGKALAEKLNKTYPGKVDFYKCDVGEEASIVQAFNAVVDKVKQLDVIINNAGLMNDSENIWSTACDVNWRGLVSFTLKGIKHMRKDHGGAGGTIVNVSSVAAFLMKGTLPIYNGSKGAVLHFSRSLALEPFYGETGVRVLTICFSATATALMQGLEERVVDSMYVKALQEIVNDLKAQRPESAVAAFMTMFKTGANGSVWLSKNDGPAQDITPTITQAYDLMQSVL